MQHKKVTFHTQNPYSIKKEKHQLPTSEKQTRISPKCHNNVLDAVELVGSKQI